MPGGRICINLHAQVVSAFQQRPELRMHRDGLLSGSLPQTLDLLLQVGQLAVEVRGGGGGPLRHGCAAGAGSMGAGKTRGAPTNASSRAKALRISVRGTTMSIKPFCRQNSAVWKSSGSLRRVGCSVPRGPANPTTGPGPTRIASARTGKL